jgi:predicted transcriptional regulator
MKERKVQYFTENEEEFINLMLGIGIKKTVAKVLLFLARTPEATSRDIERGTDLRQPEVSIAIGHLMDKGWAVSRENEAKNKGRPFKIYELAKPINEIMDSIEKETENKANNQLKLIKKLQDYIH